MYGESDDSGFMKTVGHRQKTQGPSGLLARWWRRALASRPSGWRN